MTKIEDFQKFLVAVTSDPEARPDEAFMLLENPKELEEFDIKWKLAVLEVFKMGYALGKYGMTDTDTLNRARLDREFLDGQKKLNLDN
ncbi:hypothetical protein LCGC14_0246360 [marine sediment metagenome]|uniref:Uncharacterized protein n=1 Tax=marine sediment metagenome TaxID=412755 RepID=A0A0F9U696_9ZZZZ